MDPSKSPEYLRATLNAVADFQAVLKEFLALHVFNEWLARGIAPAVFPKDTADPEEISRLSAAVAQAAGRAMDAAPLTRTFFSVQGAGAVDPIAAWQTITRPKPLLEPEDVLGATDQIIGRLEAMLLRAEVEAPPLTGVQAMHPLIWGAASRLWGDGHYRAAISAGAEALVAQVKSLTGRNDVAETGLWQEAFSENAPAPGKPRLRWPGEPTDRDVKTMNDGLRQFAPGTQMVIRNPAAHGTVEISPQEGLERLAVLSLLARWVQSCEVVEHNPRS